MFLCTFIFNLLKMINECFLSDIDILSAPCLVSQSEDCCKKTFKLLQNLSTIFRGLMIILKYNDLVEIVTENLNNSDTYSSLKSVPKEIDLPKVYYNLVGLCWGPPYPKLRFMVGEKRKEKNTVEKQATLA